MAQSCDAHACDQLLAKQLVGPAPPCRGCAGDKSTTPPEKRAPSVESDPKNRKTGECEARERLGGLYAGPGGAHGGCFGVRIRVLCRISAQIRAAAVVSIMRRARRAPARQAASAAAGNNQELGMAEYGSGIESREQEFLRLFARAQRPLHAYIVAWVYDSNVAADLLQETNIILWQKFELYESGTSFLAWAREIARRVILQHRRLTATGATMLPPELLEGFATSFSDAGEMEATDRRGEALSQCLEKLPGKDRELIRARYAPGASVSAIAKQLDRTVNSVSQSLRRIRRALAECIRRNLRVEEEAR
ncbi:MAG: hypothetical protein CMJ58_09355 [Planctomycetaceae bacterium]|nr:hypothetical protein [Planctomycetaceae bacterium]